MAERRGRLALTRQHRMRFPFTFMGLLSIALGAWIVAYAVFHPAHDAFVLGLELVPAAALLTFGGWILVRRLRGRPV